MAGSCGWPFHRDRECEECQQWEAKYGEALTIYMDTLSEMRAAARAAVVARRKTTPPTPSA